MKQFKLFRPVLATNGTLTFLTDIDVDFQDTPITGSRPIPSILGCVWDTEFGTTGLWGAGLEVVKQWTSPDEYMGYLRRGKVKIADHAPHGAVDVERLRVRSGRAGRMIVFAVEPLGKAWDEMVKLAAQHWNETQGYRHASRSTRFRALQPVREGRLVPAVHRAGRGPDGRLRRGLHRALHAHAADDRDRGHLVPASRIPQGLERAQVLQVHGGECVKRGAEEVSLTVPEGIGTGVLCERIGYKADAAANPGKYATFSPVAPVSTSPLARGPATPPPATTPPPGASPLTAPVAAQPNPVAAPTAAPVAPPAVTPPAATAPNPLAAPTDPGLALGTSNNPGTGTGVTKPGAITNPGALFQGGGYRISNEYSPNAPSDLVTNALMRRRSY
jgi:hypothetical protein